MTAQPLLVSLTGIATMVALVTPNSWAATLIPDEHRVGGFAIGCQAYTFNQFTAFEAIEKTASAGGKVIEFFPGQRMSSNTGDVKVDHNLSAADLAKLQAKLKQHGLMAVNYGVVGIPKDEAEARKLFEFAKAMGLKAITTESTDAIDTIDKLVKEYDLCVAFHNHPRRPNDANYKVWDPNYILELVNRRDARIGSGADTGHWVRSGIKPVEALRILQGRIISVHLKDLNEFKPGAHDVPFGTGVSDIPGVLDELNRQQFKGNLSIEYEYNWTNSTPEVAQCIGFVRGYAAGKK